MGGLPRPHALGGEPFAAQEPADPLIRDRRQEPALPTKLRELGHRPGRERETALGRTGEGHVHQFAQLLGLVRMGGRPFGFETRSKAAHPLALNQRIQSYAAVKWQPTRSAASTTPRPRRTSSMSRYRWCTRTDNDRSLSLARSTRCSARVSDRRRTGFGILSPLFAKGQDSMY